MTSKSECLKDFSEFLKLNMRLEDRTVRESVENVNRYLEHAHNQVSSESIVAYLNSYLKRSPSTYNAQITTLRRFVRDYLKLPDAIMSFKMAPVDVSGVKCNLPSKTQLRCGFEALRNTAARAIYLFTLSTGLRRSEISGLTKDKIDFSMRSVIPQHFTRVKRSGITFYNPETERALNAYIAEQSDAQRANPRLFNISERQWRAIWRMATRAAGIPITPKIMRVWFSTEMGELNVPDHYVDVFQGRAPRSVLAKHYTGKGLQLLKRIYDKASVSIFPLK